MSAPLTEVRRLATEHDLLPRGTTVLAACSGGSDSVALVDLLDRLATELGFALAVASIDHGLRPQSEAEVRSVESLARTLERPFRSRHLSLEAGPGLQARAREARYEALASVAAELGADRIALGHTADDQAETVLARLLRGAGVRGLAAMVPLRTDRTGPALVRPLLGSRRASLRAHLEWAGRPWIADPSNDDPRFERVRLRRRLAELESEDPQIVAHLVDLARDARAHGEVVEAAAAALGTHPSLATLGEAPEAVRRSALRAWVERAGPSPGRAHLEALEALVLTGRGEVLLPGGARVTAEGGELALDRSPRRTRSTAREGD